MRVQVRGAEKCGRCSVLGNGAYLFLVPTCVSNVSGSPRARSDTKPRESMGPSTDKHEFSSMAWMACAGDELGNWMLSPLRQRKGEHTSERFHCMDSRASTMVRNSMQVPENVWRKAPNIARDVQRRTSKHEAASTHARKWALARGCPH